ncbi:MAG TPA: GNAT family N-acetyltransferase [Candidatus Saccharimonadales bacterium]|nr:GNAT family N-acetyltransferase [Candidatus Saccharimonadales bacterium]
MDLHIATPQDNLQAICAQMQPGKWGADNEMTSYQPDELKAYLESDNTLLLLAKDGDKIAGAALCYILPHPARQGSLYAHEVDTHPDYRRQGVATQMMRELQKIAKERGLTEVWLSTESTNAAANGFYRSLNPTETEPSVVYAYEV